ncbi:hypothetical protein C8R44DRAFT_746320 [Mycena epipterygia]|nr:hypothetical protein C8R44DRAFT_746320 [Mycena epipterygia]
MAIESKPPEVASSRKTGKSGLMKRTQSVRSMDHPRQQSEHLWILSESAISTEVAHGQRSKFIDVRKLLIRVGWIAQGKSKVFREIMVKLTLSPEACTVIFRLENAYVNGFCGTVKAQAPSPGFGFADLKPKPKPSLSPDFGLAWLCEARALAFGLSGLKPSQAHHYKAPCHIFGLKRHGGVTVGENPGCKAHSYPPPPPISHQSRRRPARDSVRKQEMVVVPDQGAPPSLT